MAELVDALASGASDSNIVEVQVLSSAPNTAIDKSVPNTYPVGFVMARFFYCYAKNRPLYVLAIDYGAQILSLKNKYFKEKNCLKFS